MIFGFRVHTPLLKHYTQSSLDYIGSDNSLKEPLRTTHEIITNELPESVNSRVGSLPMGLFESPTLGTRVVMADKNHKPAGPGKVSDAGANKLFKEYSDEPFLYYAHYRQSSGLPESYEYQVTPRIFLFNPEYSITSQREYRECIECGREPDPADAFAKLGTTSTLAVIDDEYEISHFRSDWVRSPSESPVPGFNEGLPLITGRAEFEQMRRGQYGASDTLEELCAYTSLLAREKDLINYVGLSTIDPEIDPWQKAIGAVGPDIDDIGVDPHKILPEKVTFEVDTSTEVAEITFSDTANDGGELHQEGIKAAAAFLRQQGYDIIVVTQDTESRPDLWVRGTDGEILAVEVESDTMDKFGSVLKNIARQALWGYRTITVMVPGKSEDDRTESLDTLARRARENFATPWKRRESKRTLLHNGTSTIVVDGQTMLLPEGVSEAKWYLTVENDYLLMHDGEVLAHGDATEPFTEFDYHLPRYQEEDGVYVVEDQHGTVIDRYEQKADIDYTMLRECHRPVDLSYLNFVEALYSYDPDKKEIVQQEMTAPWSRSEASVENEKSHREAFENFLVEHESDDTLWEMDCRPFIRKWISQLSTRDHPGKQIYGEHRKDYFARERSAHPNGTLEQEYPNMSFRYDRGLVSPDLPGLTTEPSFGDTWGIPDADLLQDPLIHDLDHRRDVPSGGTNNTDV